VKKVDLIGKRFGDLTVIRRYDKLGKAYRYLCRCVCGNEKVVLRSGLKTGRTKSCGCLKKRRSIETKAIRESRNYWQGLRKGKAFIDPWLSDFDKFINDVGVRPKNKSLARRDISKPHSRENSFWSASTGKMVTIDGVTKNASEWAAIAGISSQALHARLAAGLTGDQILSPPVMRRPPQYVAINGVSKTCKEWAQISGVSLDCFRYRLRQGKKGCDLLAPPHRRATSAQ